MSVEMPPTPDDRDRTKNQDVDVTETTDHVIILDSSSDDEHNLDDQGYSLLPQEPEPDVVAEPEAVVDSGEDDVGIDVTIRAVIEGDSNEVMSGAGPSLFETSTPESRATAELWNEPVTHDRLAMNQEQVEKITQLMSAITLPSANHPQWARHVTDEQLKTELTRRLNKVDSKSINK